MTRRPDDERWLVIGASAQLGARVHSAAPRRTVRGTVGSRSRRVGRQRVPPRRYRRSTRSTSADRRSRGGQLASAVRRTSCTSPAPSRSRVRRGPSAARRCQVEATDQLAQYTTAAGAWMFFASSDVLWDGESRRLYKETDKCTPLSIYGTTKLAGEETVLRNSAPGDSPCYTDIRSVHGRRVSPRYSSSTRQPARCTWSSPSSARRCGA